MPDVHGKIPSAHFSKFDLIIAPGDFCGDDIRDLIFKCLFHNKEHSDDTKNWYDMVSKSQAKKMVNRSLSQGRVVLEKLDSYGVPVFIVPGNWDWCFDELRVSDWDFLNKDFYSEFLFKGLKNIVDVYHKKVSFLGFDFIGHGNTSAPEFPQNPEIVKSLDKAELKFYKKYYSFHKNKLTKLFKSAKNPVIFLSHVVPYNTSLDTFYHKVQEKFVHNGSVVARDLILEFDPIICVGAHIHEHFGSDRLKNTLCFNAGFGVEKNILVNVSNEKVLSVRYKNLKK